jgi:hypothetical protein
VTIRSVRLDEEAERALADIRRQSGQSISGAIKRSLLAFRDTAAADAHRKPAEFFREYALGEGGEAIGAARESSRLLREKLSKSRARR